MQVTFLGTGSPIPTLDRAGTGLAIEVGGEPLMVDCGPGTLHRLLEAEIHPGSIRRLFLTHAHVDHTADFFAFALSSWSLGRDALSIYGPPETERLPEALREIYAEDIAYRRQFGYPPGGIDDVEWHQVDPETVVEGAGWRATALPVDHSIETYAYRFEDTRGRAVVVSGDTRRIPELGAFAAGADLLVQDCCVGPVTPDPPQEGLVWDRLTEPLSAAHRERLLETHCDPTDAGEIAAAAGVGTLALTHLLPYRDTARLRELAADRFDGEVIVAEDGRSIEV